MLYPVGWRKKNYAAILSADARALAACPRGTILAMSWIVPGNTSAQALRDIRAQAV